MEEPLSLEQLDDVDEAIRIGWRNQILRKVARRTIEWGGIAVAAQALPELIHHGDETNAPLRVILGLAVGLGTWLQGTDVEDPNYRPDPDLLESIKGYREHVRQPNT